MGKPSEPSSTAPEPRLDTPGALAQAQKLSEIGLMTAAVLHEIKQPLAGIKGYAQMLRDVSPLAQQRADLILQQVARIEHIVGSHRRLLQSDPADRKAVDLAALAAEAVALMEPKTRHHGAKIELKVPPQPVVVQAVESQVLQILVNLLANAIDAVSQTRSTPRTVEVVVRDAPPEVLVADQGPGVPEGARAQLFTAFFTTKGAGAGTGLGLYISRTLAQANGAQLEHVTPAMAALQATTVFRLRFTPAAAKYRPSVLVVDDEKVICELFTSLLEPEGIELHIALNGEQAIRLIEQRRFDLVVSDKNLPGATGLEVARAVRARWPSCPVILMTGYASVETAQEGLEIGLVDYLEKPFDDIGEVRRRIREALGPRREAPVAPEPAPAPRKASSRRVLIVEDRDDDAVKLGEAVSMAGGVPVISRSVDEALSQMASERPAGVILSLAIKDKGLTPESIRQLRQGSDGPLITLCEHPSLEQTIAAIRMGAAACLPRALASPQALAHELQRLLTLVKAG